MKKENLLYLSSYLFSLVLFPYPSRFLPEVYYSEHPLTNWRWGGGVLVFSPILWQPIHTILECLNFFVADSVLLPRMRIQSIAFFYLEGIHTILSPLTHTEKYPRNTVAKDTW